MAAGDLTRILTALDGLRGESREALAGLKVEVSFVTGAIRDLGSKVDKMDDQKAGRNELQGVELRMERNVAEVKASAAFEAGRLSQDLTSKLDIVATDLHDFRETVAAEFKAFRERDLKEIRDEVRAHENFKNRITGGYLVASVIGGALVIAVNWVIKFWSGR